MLKLMAPENNSNPSPNDTSKSDVTVPQPAGEQSLVMPTAPLAPDISPTPPVSNEPSAPVDTSTSFTPTPPVVQETPSASSTPPNQPVKAKRSKFGYLIIALIVIMLLVGSNILTYSIGKHHQKVVVQSPAAKLINLPPQAIVSAACVPGRGKQYIIPKDIPEGPIYDVENSRVIGIEYVIGLRSLATNSDSFSAAILALTKNYPVDHFTVVPSQPQPGDTDTYIHLIMFIVSKAEANSITCGATTGSTTTPATTTNTTKQ